MVPRRRRRRTEQLFPRTRTCARREYGEGSMPSVRPSVPPPRPASLLLFEATKFHPGWPGREKGGRKARRGRKSEEEEDAKEVLLPDCRTTHALTPRELCVLGCLLPFSRLLLPSAFRCAKLPLKNRPFSGNGMSQLESTRYMGRDEERKGRTTKPSRRLVALLQLRGIRRNWAKRKETGSVGRANSFSEPPRE